MAKYKSQDGCCICGIKSSNSRFTSSSKYETDFRGCFKVLDRCGDICNPCVLTVKRWRKTPCKDFSHMVDKKRNGGPRNLKTILKREKKAKEKYLNTGSKRRKNYRPMCLSGKDPKTRLSFVHIEERLKHETKTDQFFGIRNGMVMLNIHMQKCNSSDFMDICTVPDVRSEIKTDSSHRCNSDNGNSVETDDEKQMSSSVQEKHPDTGDESGIDSADFDSTRS